MLTLFEKAVVAHLVGDWILQNDWRARQKVSSRHPAAWVHAGVQAVCLERFQCRVAAFYFQRVSLPVQFWRACGCPPRWRPRLPWWQPFVWRWLRLSGWQR